MSRRFAQLMLALEDLVRLVERGIYKMAKKLHPDVEDTAEQFHGLVRAREEALAYLATGSCNDAGC